MRGLAETDHCMVATTVSLFRHCTVGPHCACKENLHALWLKWSRSALGAGGMWRGNDLTTISSLPAGLNDRHSRELFRLYVAAPQL